MAQVSRTVVLGGQLGAFKVQLTVSIRSDPYSNTYILHGSLPNSFNKSLKVLKKKKEKLNHVYSKKQNKKKKKKNEPFREFVGQFLKELHDSL